METFPRSAMGFCTATGRYTLSREKAAARAVVIHRFNRGGQGDEDEDATDSAPEPPKQPTTVPLGADAAASGAPKSEEAASESAVAGAAAAAVASAASPDPLEPLRRVTKHMVRFVPLLLRPTASRGEQVFQDVAEGGKGNKLTLHPNRKLSSTLQGMGMDSGALLIPRKVG